MRKHVNFFPYKWGFLSLFIALVTSNVAFADDEKSTVIINSAQDGRQITRFDTKEEAIDAHDGEIAFFNGVYYLYGTSYDCGYQWQTKDAPFCGFKVYSSKDLMTWTDEGFLFDAQTEEWQKNCNGNTYGCYRPHVLYNKKNNNYVLWINSYDVGVGFHVFTSPTPVGPFTEVAIPTLGVNSDQPAGLNNGDHDLFLDDDGTAYIAYTDWRTGGTIVVDKLNEDFTSGTGNFVKGVVGSNTEAPGLFKYGGKYYIFYSDPNCGYCAGTGTSYRTALHPLGPWTGGTKVNGTSCAGQPSFVSVFEYENDTILLYGSDRWNHAYPNEALANYYWAPIEIAPNGVVFPFECQAEITVPLIKQEKVIKETPNGLDCTSGVEGFTSYSDLGGNIQRGQTFVATRTGILTTVSFATSRLINSQVGLTIQLYKTATSGLPTGEALSTSTVPLKNISWSPKFVTVHPNIEIEAGLRYAIIVKAAGDGNFSFQYNDEEPYKDGVALYSNNTGGSFRVEEKRTLMFKTFIGSEPIPTETQETMLDAEFDAYPNPVNQLLNVTVENAKAGSEIKVFDKSGIEVLSKRITENISDKLITFNVSSLTSGIYVAKLNDGTILKTVKIIKQ